MPAKSVGLKKLANNNIIFYKKPEIKKNALTARKVGCQKNVH